MITTRIHTTGFTAVEVLISMFIASAFIIAGYQLYAVIIKDNGDTRAQSVAANLTYSYLRQYADSADCSSSTGGQTLLAPTSITASGIAQATMTVTSTCPSYSQIGSNDAISEVTAKLTYNNPQQIVTNTIYVLH